MKHEIIVSDCMTAHQVVQEQMRELDHEEVWGLFLTTAHHVIAAEMLSKGTLTQTSIDCRTVLRRALLLNAGAVILFHNHPSGNPTPSVADIIFTKDLKAACDLMDIKLLDHIVTTNHSFYSFADEKTIKTNQNGTVK